MTRVVFASMSGNAQWVAEQIAARLGTEARPADLVRLDELATADRLVAVIPTWGRGELPADARTLASELARAGSAALSRTRFAVVALGDRRYPDFCAGGLEFARLLVEAGATELAPPLLLDGVPAERHGPAVLAWVDTHCAAPNTAATIYPPSLEVSP